MSILTFVSALIKTTLLDEKTTVLVVIWMASFTASHE